jgi:hypothetical protein
VRQAAEAPTKTIGLAGPKHQRRTRKPKKQKIGLRSRRYDEDGLTKYLQPRPRQETRG